MKIAILYFMVILTILSCEDNSKDKSSSAKLNVISDDVQSEGDVQSEDSSPLPQKSGFISQPIGTFPNPICGTEILFSVTIEKMHKQTKEKDFDLNFKGFVCIELIATDVSKIQIFVNEKDLWPKKEFKLKNMQNLSKIIPLFKDQKNTIKVVMKGSMKESATINIKSTVPDPHNTPEIYRLND